MLSLLILLAAAQAQAPAATPAPGTPSAAPARTLQDLPGTTIQYYDVPGRDARTIQKNLKKILSTPNSTAARGYDWALGMSINRRTEGTTCTVTSAKATLKANAYLPRLTEEARLPAEDLASWKSYVAGIEKTATDNLSFVVDRVPAIEQSLIGKPCDQASAIWNKAIDDLMKQQADYAKQLAAASKTKK